MSFARIVPNPIIPNRLDLLNNGDLPRDMVGVTIQAKRRPTLSKQKSEITLDSHLCQKDGQYPHDASGGFNIDDDDDCDSPGDVLAFKIKVAELQTELQAQQVRVSKYQALLSKVHGEYMVIQKENMELKQLNKIFMKAEDSLKDQLDLVQRENTELKKVMKTMFNVKRGSKCMSIGSNELNPSLKLSVSGSRNESTSAFSDSRSSGLDLCENENGSSISLNDDSSQKEDGSNRSGKAGDILVMSNISMGTLDVEFQTSETTLEKKATGKATLRDDFDIKFKPKSKAKRRVNNVADHEPLRNFILSRAENNHDDSIDICDREISNNSRTPKQRNNDFPQQQETKSRGSFSQLVQNMSWNLTTSINAFSNDQTAADVNNLVDSSVEDLGRNCIRKFILDTPN